MNKKMNNKGFSLVELIVVIAIMAVLVGVLAPQFIKYVENSRQSTDMQNIQHLKTTVEVECTADQNITGAYIQISGTGKSAAITTTPANSITGTATETNLKSSGWDTIKYTYDVTTGAWTPDDATKSKNGNKPENDLKDIFE